MHEIAPRCSDCQNGCGVITLAYTFLVYFRDFFHPNRISQSPYRIGEKAIWSDSSRQGIFCSGIHFSFLYTSSSVQMSGLFCILLQMVTVIHFSWQALSIESGDILHYKAGAMNVINDGKPTFQRNQSQKIMHRPSLTSFSKE